MKIVKLAIFTLYLNASIVLNALSTQSPVRLCDTLICDFTVQYSDSVFTLNFQTPYAQEKSQLTYCYRKRPVVNADSGQCDLSGYDGQYSCVYIQTGLNFYQFKSTSALLAKNDTKLDMDSSKYKTAAKYISTNLDVEDNYVYEIVIGLKIDLSKDTNAKSAYFQTFRKQTIIKYSGNLLLPRYFICYTYYYQNYFNYNVIFYGGYVRDGFDTMYFGFVSYLSDDGTTVATDGLLNIWGGLGFSTSHASRDMIGFSSGFGYLYDLYSLYTAAPYNDTATNINGTMSIKSLFTSNQQATISYFIAASCYRLYDTKDTVSDQIIRKKMNYQFCYAIGYSQGSTSIDPTGTVKHSFVDCFKPNIVVWQPKVQLSILLVFTLLIISYL